MTAIEWTTIMVIDSMALSLWVVGETAYRSLQRALAADTLRRIQADTAHYDFLYGGSAAQGVETPPPAPGCRTPLHPGAGPKLQADDSRLDLAGALDPGVEPAPGVSFLPGAGPEPRTAALSALPNHGEADPPDGSGGPGHIQPVGVGAPDLAPIGVTPHPRGEGVGAASPRLVAPTRGAA